MYLNMCAYVNIVCVYTDNLYMYVDNTCATKAMIVITSVIARSVDG